MTDVGRLVDALPEGWSEVAYAGRRYGLTKTTHLRGRSLSVYAEELGGTDVISANVYRTGAGDVLKPCEMPAAKVLDFLSTASPVTDCSMLTNRTMPDDVLVPVLAYPSVSEAVTWLTEAFGFSFRWQVEEHRAQLGVGEHAALAITAGSPPSQTTDHVMVRVADVEAHRAHAAAVGAIVGGVEDHFYGERQYSATDFAGRTWIFTQSIADVDPSEWGARTDSAGPAAPAEP